MLCCGGYGMMCLLVIFMWFCFRCYVPKTSDSPTVRQSDICTCMGWKRPTVRHQLSGPTKELQPSVQRLGLEGQVVKSCKDVSMVKPILPKLSHFFHLWPPVSWSSWSGLLALLIMDFVGPLDHGLCWSSWSTPSRSKMMKPRCWRMMSFSSPERFTVQWMEQWMHDGQGAQHKQRTISVHPWRNAMHSPKNWSSAMVAHNLFKRPTSDKPEEFFTAKALPPSSFCSAFPRLHHWCRTSIAQGRSSFACALWSWSSKTWMQQECRRQGRILKPRHCKVAQFCMLDKGTILPSSHLSCLVDWNEIQWLV